MDYFFIRNRNKGVLGGLLAAQLVLLSYQVRRPDAGGVRVAQLWGFQAIMPAEKASERAVAEWRNLIHGYVALRQVNRKNEALEAELAQLRIQDAQLRESVRDVPRLDALLSFEHSYGLRTAAAQVISSGASEDSQSIYLDKGANAGFARNMAVITPDGIVGKLSQVLSSSAQVLLVTDPNSGVGALMSDSGVHGILRGLGAGRVEMRMVLNDESVKAGEAIITSGEDQIYPKGIPIGVVTSVRPGPIFQEIKVKLAPDLSRLEEVLVITGAIPPPAELPVTGMTAAEIRQQQLPALPTPSSGVVNTAKPLKAGAEIAFPGRPSDTPPAEGDALGAAGGVGAAPAAAGAGAKPGVKPAAPAPAPAPAGPPHAGGGGGGAGRR